MKKIIKLVKTLLETNLVTNPDGSVVDTYLEKTLFQEAGQTTPYTWSWFKPAGGWTPMNNNVNGYVDHIAYDDGGDWGSADFDYFPKYFIQSDDFDSSLGFIELQVGKDYQVLINMRIGSNLMPEVDILLVGFLKIHIIHINIIVLLQNLIMDHIVKLMELKQMMVQLIFLSADIHIVIQLESV